MAVKAPQEVIDGITRVRDSAKTNMFAIKTVQYYADENGDFLTVNWIQEHQEDYLRGIREGYEAKEATE